MKKIINGRLYDTETAKWLASWENECYCNDFAWCCEALYRKRTGEYFLHGKGGGLSKYASPVCGGGWTFGEAIRALSEEQARMWAEEKLCAEEYAKLFGIIPDAEEEGGEVLTVALGKEASGVLQKLCDENSASEKAVIESLLLKKGEASGQSA